jgi:hypothetical protein
MKLIGSLTEQQMREELIQSNLALRDDTNHALRHALESANVNVAAAYVIHWIPEQVEDIYDVLVSAGEVLTVEVPRVEGQILLKRVALATYERKCSKSHRLKIAVALDLLASGAARRVR